MNKATVNQINAFASLIVIVLAGIACHEAVSDEGRTYGPVVEAVPAGAERRCLSLRALIDHVNAAIEQGTPVSEEALHLAGIGRLEGYVVDEEEDDVILVGIWEPGRPSLHLDDLVTIMRNVWRGRAYPACSLDPRPENVCRVQALLDNVDLRDPSALAAFLDRLREAIGPQDTRIEGVPRSSRLTAYMVNSDYSMKAASQGLIEIPGVTSCLAIAIEEARRAIEAGRRTVPAAASLDRFWFHVEEGEPTFREASGKSIVWLDACSVVVLTEQQRAEADGTLRDAGRCDPRAARFAEEFSAAFPRMLLDETFVEFARLDNAFRLMAILHAMHHRRALERAELNVTDPLDRWQLEPMVSLPPSMPGLANAEFEIFNNGRYIWHFAPIVCGGVSMEMNVREQSIRRHKLSDHELSNMRILVLRERPALGVLWWMCSSKARS
jgi:hypothetical protein